MRATAEATDAKSRLAGELASSKANLAKDFRNLVNDAEELLRTTGSYSGEGFAQARTRFEERLRDLKRRIPDAESYLADRYHEIAADADHYVRTNPWQAIGMAAAVGALIGFLGSRRLP